MRLSILPVMTVLTVVAGAAGLQVGESAIAQIDPLYFQGPAPTPIDRSLADRPESAPTYADATGHGEGFAARAEDCPDCGAAPAGGVPPTRRWEVAADVPTYPAARRELAAVEESAEVAPDPVSPQSASVRRYTSYPVSADQPVRKPEIADRVTPPGRP